MAWTTLDETIDQRTHSGVGWLFSRQTFWVFLAAIAAFALMAALRPDTFATAGNLFNVTRNFAFVAIMALGMTAVIITGGIDLSVGSLVAFSGLVGAYVAKGGLESRFAVGAAVESGNPVILAVLAALAVGIVGGAIQGFVITRFRVPPFVATLAMLTAGSGLAYAIGNGAPINGLPSGYGAFANTEVFGITIPVLLMIVGFIVFWFVLQHTTYGLRVYAVGGNSSAASLAGVPTRRMLASVYIISGALAGVSGLMISSRVISGAPTLGQGYELDAIAAVVIGGASLFGGRGTVWGTLLGLLLIQTLNNGLQILVIPAYWQAVIKGALIAAAVGIDVWASRRASR